MRRILIVFGTRPEAIKMAPLFNELKKHIQQFETKICVTAQHREMLDQVLDFFKIKPDYDLNIMKDNQTLTNITSEVLKKIDEVIDDFNPDMIITQGDTTTTFVASLAAFYKKIEVAHIEAGLRSFDKYSPFPEEINRTLTSRIATLHFAPTERNQRNLNEEGIRDNVHVVGNTVIDALFLGLERIRNTGESEYAKKYCFINFNSKIILVTGHRRENFGEPFLNICNALKTLSSNKAVEIIYPVHLNPNVRKPVYDKLDGISNIHLIEPVEYPELIWLLDKSYIVLTDSGGIQEEAPSLGKPVLVMRDVTERQEGIESGTAKLVGTDKDTIIKETEKLLFDENAYSLMSKSINPYGDGTTSKRIVKIIDQYLNNE
jgi:UDP-N-acetylglucosamine 2-epimerase (non-hydrolysing)